MAIESADVFETLVSTRYATKKFDGKEVNEKTMQRLYEMIRLAPSSLNIQPWKIIAVKNAKLKERLKKASYDQEQITSCSHLLVFCTDTNTDGLIARLENGMRQSGVPESSVQGFIGMVKGFLSGLTDAEAKKAWLQRQVYLAVENALLGAKALGLDSCPMEGFLPAEYSKILGLPDNLIPTVVVPVGFASDKPRKKFRLELKDIIKSIE